LVGLITRRDLRESTSDVRLALSMISLTFIIPLIAALGVALADHTLGPQGAGVIERLVEVGAFFVVFLPASFSLVLALESFSGERERSTLETLFATPLRESEIYLGKIGAVIIPSLSLSYAALVVYTLAVLLFTHAIVARELAPLVVVTLAQALVMVAGSTIVSSQTKTLRSANVMASFIIIPMSGIIQGESILIISRLEWMLWGVAAGLIVLALLLLRLGLAIFNRETILAKDSRPPDRRAWARRLVGWRPSLAPAEIGRAFVRSRGAILTAALLLVAGALFGVVAQQLNLVPAQPVGTLVRQQAAMGHEVVAGNSHLFALILGHNLVAGGLMAVLAPVSLGVVGGLFTLLNGFVVGYVGGTFAAWSHLGFFVCGVAPHGIIELPALVLASGFALRIGASMVRPAPAGWWSGIGLAVTDYVRGMVVVIPMFTFAAAIEAYLTPALLQRC
jgi:uncharacterized membrane protein SpoIIM required for sporulation